MASDVHDINDPMDLDPEFAPFPHLPKELRDEIWSYTFTFIEPRTVELVTCDSVFSVDGKHIPLKNRVGAKPAPVPPIFHACFESRSRAMKEFPSAFSGLIDNGPIFFDFSKDTILFDSLKTYQNLLRSTHCSLRGLVEAEEEVQKARRHFERNIRFMAVKDCITSHSDRDFKQLYSLERLTFLNDSYRYWPLRPDFSAPLLPIRLPSESVRMRVVNMHEARLQIEWLHTSMKNNPKGSLSSKTPQIEYKDIYDMVPSMGAS